MKELFAELSPTLAPPTWPSLRAFFEAENTLAVAAQKGKIIGMASLVLIRRANGTTGQIESVVVSASHRGKGISKKLMRSLIETAREQKLGHLDLTTAPRRVEANSLYMSLGFQRRETNVYRLVL